VNIYVETNFLIEIALQQEDFESCEKIMLLCEAGKANLIVPAYGLSH
jgi:hypothetical protein